MMKPSMFMEELHGLHIRAELGELNSTCEALRLSIIVAAIELDVATGLDAEALLADRSMLGSNSARAELSKRMTLDAFLAELS